MDEELLKDYLEHLGIRNSRLKRIINTVKKFEKYMDAFNKNLDNAGYEDLENFLNEYYQRYTSQYYTGDLKFYYKLTENTLMQDAIEELKFKYTPPFNLTGFQNIKKEYINKLKERGIRTNNQLLYSCRTIEDRKELAKKISIPLEEINKITKLSDLTRIFAVKATRAQLYYEAGIDTVEKIATLDAVELRNIVVQYAKENNFPGIPTLPKEAEATVNLAKRLYKVVEF